MSELAALPAIAADAAIVPYGATRGTPHVVVDGPAQDGTVLGLSHWPDGGTPAALAADTSTEIVARYRTAAATGPEVARVTNNHYDEDGMLAVWLLLADDPAPALAAAAVAAARAGDFATWTDPVAAQAALALAALAEPGLTPLPAVARALARSGGDPAAALMAAVLPHVERVLTDPERYRASWDAGWRRVASDLDLLASGTATIDDDPGRDLAVVRAPHILDPMAVHPHVASMRVLHVVGDGRLVLEHRYETWVTYASRALPPRRGLDGVADRLNSLAAGPGIWRFEGVAHPRARLRYTDVHGGDVPAPIDAGRLVAELTAP